MNDDEWSAVLGLLDAGRLREASDRLRDLIGGAPQLVEPAFQLAVSLHRDRKPRKALAVYDALLETPLAGPAYANRGLALKRLGFYDEALRSLVSAVVLDPADAGFHSRLGALLQEAGETPSALFVVQRALALDPALFSAWTVCGHALIDARRIDAGTAILRRAMLLAPERASTHFNYSFALLARGDYAEGWREHEWRWHVNEMRDQDVSSLGPMWKGEPIRGKTILVSEEGGFGDTLQFVRLLKLLKDRHVGPEGRVVLRCRQPLVRLLRGVAGADVVEPGGDGLPASDCHIPMMSLMERLGVTLDTLPAEVPYVGVDPAEAARWNAVLAPTGRLKVGLVWSGNPRDENPAARRFDAWRSLPLALLAPLAAVPGIDWYSLQKDAATEQIAESGNVLGLRDPMGMVQDFADTAAIIAHLDLVIAVDTSVVHLAGAMGKPVWCLSRFAACWRWLDDRDDSPWYPTLRLFRQPYRNDWDSVVHRVAAELNKVVNGDLPLAA
jgi:Flp pilus assembly protein TadD